MLGVLVFLVCVAVCAPAIVRAAVAIRRASQESAERSYRNRYPLYEDDDRAARSAAKAPPAVVRPLVHAAIARILACVAGVWLLNWGIGNYVDYLWYKDLGYPGRFTTEIVARVVMSLVYAVVSGGILFLAARSVQRVADEVCEKKVVWLRYVMAAFVAGGTILFTYLQDEWLEALRAFHGHSFGKVDPVFGKDIGFYAFTLPFLDAMAGFLLLVAIVAAVGCVISFFGLAIGVDILYEDSKEVKEGFFAKTFGALAPFGALFFAALIAVMYLGRYEVLYSSHGNVYGAGWTDLFVRIPATWVFMGALVFGIAMLGMVAMGRHAVRNSIIAFGSVLLVWLAGMVIAPAIAQHTYVSPNELQVEQPYIERELAFTRAAYDVADVRQDTFNVQDGLTPANLTKNAQTIESARIWDWRVLLATNHQIQAFKAYYDFPDVDTLRYDIGGKKTQIMYSAREMNVNSLPDAAKTWQNEHLVYTHGYGGTANPVNTFTGEGLPDYWVKDIPVTSKVPELAITQPRIYFGEDTTNHVYVHTKMKEFDYPVGEQSKFFSYDGPAGIRLGGFLRRLAIAWVFDGVWKTWSDELGPDSKLLYWRDIPSRTEGPLSFLWHENDVYQVIADGQLWYMQDFESVTEWYPYSKPQDGINYMRNAVKAVVNAYTGATTFYVFAPDDPVIQTYEEIFPELFKPAAAMPESLKKHIRYPEGLFDRQAALYASYHMTDPTSFYNKEDVWDFAQEFSPQINRQSTVDAQYLVMTLPGETSPEYVMLLPFTPHSTNADQQRNNLESLLLVRCDPPHYGQLILYKFPSTRLVQGPLQVGIKLNQDTELSKEFTLWNQQGSQVIMGEVRILPLSDHRLLSVQAIYLQSEGAKMPQLKYVVVASGDQVIYKPNFHDALATLAGMQPNGSVPFPQGGSVGVVGIGVNLTQEVLKDIDQYLRSLQQGDFSQAGNVLQKIRDDRARMSALKGR